MAKGLSMFKRFLFAALCAALAAAVGLACLAASFAASHAGVIRSSGGSFITAREPVIHALQDVLILARGFLSSHYYGTRDQKCSH